MEQRWFVWSFLGEPSRAVGRLGQRPSPGGPTRRTTARARWQVPDDVTAEDARRAADAAGGGPRTVRRPPLDGGRRRARVRRGPADPGVDLLPRAARSTRATPATSTSSSSCGATVGPAVSVGSEAGDALAAAGLLVEVLVLEQVQHGHADLAAGPGGPVDVEELGDHVRAGQDDRLAAVDLGDLGGQRVDRRVGDDAARSRWRPAASSASRVSAELGRRSAPRSPCGPPRGRRRSSPSRGRPSPRRRPASPSRPRSGRRRPRRAAARGR